MTNSRKPKASVICEEIRAPKDFIQLLEKHMTTLRWSQRDLAENAGISRTRVSACLGDKKRQLSKVDVNQVAVALAVGYDKFYQQHAPSSSLQYGTAFIDSMLNELLEQAGYPAIRGDYQEEILDDDYWNTDPISDKQEILRIGYFPWGDFMQDERGLSWMICDQVRIRLGIKKMELVPLSLKDIESELHKRNVHLLAPMLQLPSRMSKMASSDPIPHISVGINGIIKKTASKSIPTTAQGSASTIDWSMINIHYVEGGVPETLKDIIMPKSQRLKMITEPLAHLDFQTALEAVLTDKQTKKISCLIADEITCLHIKRTRGDAIELLTKNSDDLKWDHESLVFPVVFGVHPQERRFLQRINTCIAQMESNLFFQYHLLDNKSQLDYAEIIHPNHWLSQDSHFIKLHDKLNSLVDVKKDENGSVTFVKLHDTLRELDEKLNSLIDVKKDKNNSATNASTKGRRP